MSLDRHIRLPMNCISDVPFACATAHPHRRCTAGMHCFAGDVGPNFWFGLTHAPGGAEYRWSDGTPFDYQFWESPKTEENEQQVCVCE